ncbi:MAG: cell division protein FtsL [Atopobiaceae bacterium]|nr:cell division protein FtsL [Atopobiaceae bacterium]MBR1830434.1 cell division protein FtsL [Atopobiaceae bacterium]
MSYRGTEAPRLDFVERQWDYQVAERPSFDVFEGGGADARARRGVTMDFVLHMRLAMLAIAAFMVLGAARVALTTATVTHLQSNLQLQASIEEAEAVNSSLRIERSVLSNTSRITRIATQNYGMVYATEHDRVSLPTAEEEALKMRAEVEVETASSTGGSFAGAESMKHGPSAHVVDGRPSEDQVADAVAQSLASSSEKGEGLIDEVSTATGVVMAYMGIPVNLQPEA